MNSTGSSGLQYDSTAIQFTCTWATQSAPGCYTLLVTLDSVQVSPPVSILPSQSRRAGLQLAADGLASLARSLLGLRQLSSCRVTARRLLQVSWPSRRCG
jgi:hypothetical protein